LHKNELKSLVDDITRQFHIPGEIIDITPFGQGLINDTFKVSTENSQHTNYILQKINRNVFSQPRLIIDNIRITLEHINKKHSDSDKLVFPKLCATKAGEFFAVDQDQQIWRMLEFIENTIAYETITSTSLAEEVGHTLGHFHCLTHDLNPEKLNDILPHFHITPSYYREYCAALKSHSTVKTENDKRFLFCQNFIESRKMTIDILEKAKAAGDLSIRIIHGDPKLNNILFDKTSNKAKSIIDLDTIKPGLVHYDLGDCIRSCCNPGGENPKKASDISFDFIQAKSLLGGYLEQARRFMSATDITFIPDAIRLLPIELGIRFFTDYLVGNKYFKTQYAEQNLERAQAQFLLAADIEKKLPKLKQLLSQL